VYYGDNDNDNNNIVYYKPYFNVMAKHLSYLFLN
jgi:hypothetical protein